jgi:hypothetical protein
VTPDIDIRLKMFSYGLDNWGDSWQGKGCILATASQMALGPTQPPIQWVVGTFYMSKAARAQS